MVWFPRWFFKRYGEYLRFEVRQAPDGPAYELLVCYPDAQQQLERIEGAGALVERFKETQDKLHVDGWKVAGSPSEFRIGRAGV